MDTSVKLEPFSPQDATIKVEASEIALEQSPPGSRMRESMASVNFNVDPMEQWVACNVCLKTMGLVSSGSIYVCSVKCYVAKKAGRPITLTRANRMWVERVVFPNPGRTVVLQFPNRASPLVPLWNVFLMPANQGQQSVVPELPISTHSCQSVQPGHITANLNFERPGQMFRRASYPGCSGSSGLNQQTLTEDTHAPEDFFGLPHTSQTWNPARYPNE